VASAERSATNVGSNPDASSLTAFDQEWNKTNPLWFLGIHLKAEEVISSTCQRVEMEQSRCWHRQEFTNSPTCPKLVPILSLIPRNILTLSRSSNENSFSFWSQAFKFIEVQYQSLNPRLASIPIVNIALVLWGFEETSLFKRKLVSLLGWL